MGSMVRVLTGFWKDDNSYTVHYNHDRQSLSNDDRKSTVFSSRRNVVSDGASLTDDGRRRQALWGLVVCWLCVLELLHPGWGGTTQNRHAHLPFPYPFPPLSYFLPSFIFSPIPLNRSRGLGSAVSSPSRVQSGATRAIWCIFRSKNVYACYQTNNDGYYFFIFHDESLKNYLLQSWCLSTLMRVPEKEEKVPRFAPAWVIGCVAYAMHYWLHKIIKLAFFLCFL